MEHMDLDGPRYADRSERGKLRFTGEQRVWFLDQILTQSFEDIVPGEARDTAMLTVNGRMTGYLEVVATEDALLAHFEEELRSSLPEELSRYVFATRVEIADVTDDWALVLLAGPGHEDGLQRVSPGAVVHPTQGLGCPAAYVWLPLDEAPRFADALEKRGFSEAGEDELEAVRIANGVARWGRDMDSRTLAPEAGITDRAIHLEKGCYLGQEAIAKIHFRGKVNRHLRRLRSAAPLRSGAEVFAGEEKVGTVTSASDGRALAILKHTVVPGAHVQVGEAEAEVLGEDVEQT
jgi:tRNA-modifying protein YgfZ